MKERIKLRSFALLLARANRALFFDCSVTCAAQLKSEPRIFLSVNTSEVLKIGQPDESMTHIDFIVKKLFEKMRINNRMRKAVRVGHIPSVQAAQIV
jgi:hypothetical protein